MTDASWKAFERRVAKRIGGRRNPGSGAWKEAGVLGDVIHDVLHDEAKLWGKGGKWLWDIIVKAEAEAKAEGKISVVSLKRKGQGVKGFVWVVHDSHIMTLAREIFVARVVKKAGMKTEELTEEQEQDLKAYKDTLRLWWETEVMG